MLLFSSYKTLKFDFSFSNILFTILANSNPPSPPLAQTSLNVTSTFKFLQKSFIKLISSSESVTNLFIATTTGILKYVYDQLNDDDIDMFEAMPIEMTLKYDGLPRFTICHGSPFKVNQSMRPDYEYIDNLLENMPSNLIICGHFHIQTDYVRNDVRVINPGAVGVALHSNSLAQFMTLTGKDGHWEPQFFSVGYDVDKVIDEMEKERLDFKAPGWFRMTKNLLTTGEKSIVNFISEVQQVYYKETGISDYRLIPEAFWDKTLTRLGI